MERLSSSGTLGGGGRFPERAEADRAAGFVLAGEPLPVVSALRAYTCGITPYDVTHLGHAAVFVWADLLRSVGRQLGCGR